MTEKLRYIGTTSLEFYHGEVYTLTVSMHSGMYWLAEVGRQGHPYESLADILRYWLPVSHP